MKNHLKGALKVFVDYCVALLLFAIFILAFLKHLIIYSIVMFIILAGILYADMKKLAEREIRPQYNLKPYPFKGLILGVVGFLPVILVELVSPMINISTKVLNFGALKNSILMALLGPVYFIIKLGGKSTGAFIIASAAVPVIAALGYLAGYYKFEIRLFSRKTVKNPPAKKK